MSHFSKSEGGKRRNHRKGKKSLNFKSEDQEFYINAKKEQTFEL